MIKNKQILITMTTRDKITFPENESKFESESDLMVAIRYSNLGSNLDIAKLLLENYVESGTSINKVDDEGKTLLITSLCMYKKYVDIDIIKLIIEKGAYINKKLNPLTDILDKLEGEGIIPNKLKKEINNITNSYTCENIPLISALDNDHFDIIRFLLEKDCDINEKSFHGDTFLISAVMSNKIKALK